MLNVLTVNWTKGLIGRVGDPKKKNIPFHTDAAQSCGKIEVDVEKLQLDLLTIAGHKITHQMVWVLSMLERELPSDNFVHKAGKERGRRAGTENIPYIVGLGIACDIAKITLPTRSSCERLYL